MVDKKKKKKKLVKLDMDFDEAINRLVRVNPVQVKK